jgi:hypothetical protein
MEVKKKKEKEKVGALEVPGHTYIPNNVDWIP